MSSTEFPLITLSDSDSPNISASPRQNRVRKRKRTKTKKLQLEKSEQDLTKTTEVLSNSFMSRCCIPAEENGWQWKWRLPPNLASETDEDSSLSSDDELRRPPKKRLRWMTDKMPHGHFEKSLTQLNSTRLLKNLMTSEKEFPSINITSDKNGSTSTSNTEVNEVLRISTSSNNTKDNISPTSAPHRTDDDITIIRVNKVTALNSRKKKNKASTSKHVDLASSDDDIIILKDVDIPRGIPKDVKRRRQIVIDGSNVALEHGRDQNSFSCKGIQICVDFFLKRDHSQITVFVPDFRRYRTSGFFKTTDASIIEDLAQTRRLFFTPTTDGRLSNDRFIVELAATTDGVILSNDKFESLIGENDSYKKAIKERLLMFCFVGDLLMIPNDPLGLQGPCLEEFLSFPKQANSSA